MINKKQEVINKLKDKEIFKVKCEYWIRCKDKEEAEEYVIQEMCNGTFFESHLMIEEDSCKPEDIYNEENF